MPTKIASFFMGAIYLAFGIMGCIPSLVWPPPPRLDYWEYSMVGKWGYLLGWMPVNIVHNIAFIALGASGILAAPVFFGAKWYCRGLFVIGVGMVTLGIMPLGIDRVWGLIPLFDWNVMFNTVFTILAYYFGFIYPLDLGGPEVLMDRALARL